MEEIQSLQQQLEVMQKYAEEIDEKLAEFARTKESVAEMKNIKDAELYVPVASGMFAKVKGAQFDQLLVAVGANIAVTKTIPQIQSFLDNQISEVEEVKAHISHSVEMMTQRMQKLIEGMHGTVQ